MINLKKVIIIGGDERQKRLCGLFENKCRCIYISNNSELEKEKFEDANLIILPLPVTKNGRDIYSDCGKIAVENVTNKLCKNNIVSGGLIDKKLKNKLSESGIKYFDYYADETFRIFNAYLTAQGAAKIVLENTEDFIVSKKILITGFGRVGKACARVLSGIGTDVYIAARNPSQRSEAVCMGYKAVDISEISRIIYIFDFIINTVPAQIFTIKNIMTMRERAVYIELASKPFGALEADFESEKKRYILASSLPGRFYPNSCAEAIYKTINDYMGKEITNSQ